MRWSAMILTALLTVCLMSSAASAQDGYPQIPAGSVVTLPDGDTLRVGTPSRLVSDSALVAIDSTLRATRSDLANCRETTRDRAEQVRTLKTALDSASIQLTRERVWRETTTDVLAEQSSSPLVETIRDFGLVAGGFAVCRATEGQ